MTDRERFDEEEEQDEDEEVAPEVGTSFTTKGLGWSGRENQER